jgi:hypothetical protein
MPQIPFVKQPPSLRFFLNSFGTFFKLIEFPRDFAL